MCKLYHVLKGYIDGDKLLFFSIPPIKMTLLLYRGLCKTTLKDINLIVIIKR